MCQFLVSVSKENSSTAEVLESISRNVRVKPENLRLAEVRYIKYFRFYTLDRHVYLVRTREAKLEHFKDTVSLSLSLPLPQPAEPQPKAVKTPESLTDNIKTGRLVAERETKSQCFDR